MSLRVRNVPPVARSRSVFRCTSCGGASPKWTGRCPACDDWNTLVEELDVAPAVVAAAPATRPVPITELDTADGRPVPTGIDELDRVLGGGLVPGSVTLIGGEPGVGKSTLVLQMLAARARSGSTVLYVTGEESVEQVRLRAERLGALHERLLLVAETALPNVLAHMGSRSPGRVRRRFGADPVRPVVLVRARIGRPRSGSAPHRLVQEAKRSGTTVVLVGHVTKDGQLAGPRVLEHVVDTVLSIDGDRHHDLRFVRAVKHRFGSTEELGLSRSARPAGAGGRSVGPVPGRPPHRNRRVRS